MESVEEKIRNVQLEDEKKVLCHKSFYHLSHIYLLLGLRSFFQVLLLFLIAFPNLLHLLSLFFLILFHFFAWLYLVNERKEESQWHYGKSTCKGIMNERAKKGYLWVRISMKYNKIQWIEQISAPCICIIK